MTKRRKAALIGVAILAVIVLANFYSSDLIGWWRGEAKYKGRYTNSWRVKLRPFEGPFVEQESLYCVKYTFMRQPSKWDEWLANILPSRFNAKVDFDPPLQDGDHEAAGVLAELLGAPEPNVRVLAALGLKQIGKPARDAVPALLVAAEDKDPYVAMAAEDAVGSVDPGLAVSRCLARLGWFDPSQGSASLGLVMLLVPQTPARFDLMLRRLAHDEAWREFVRTSNDNTK
jgi:hypothetical protein